MVDRCAFTVQSLPNEVLLYIFSFHRLLSGTKNRPPAVAWRWHTLAHVCQRWRHLILGSLRHLGARLLIPRNSLKTSLDSWPAPLSIWCDSEDYMSYEQMADVVAAFKHSDRIREISLSVTIDHPFWRQSHNDKSFLELEHLALSGSRPYYFPIALPHEFLGGSTGPRRLRNIVLNDVYLPDLPQLLLSNRDLVSLHLGYYSLTCVGLISPEVLATSLSAATQLEYLYIGCLPLHSESLLEWTSGNSSPLAVLPALTYFHFGAFVEYMENFVSRIHAPHLKKLDVYFANRNSLDIPQLSQFISRTERLSSLPSRTSISLDRGSFTIKHHFNFPPSPEVCHVYLKYSDTRGWRMSQVDYICKTLSPLVSRVKQLKLSVFQLPSILKRKTDPAPWLQLLAPYNSVEEVKFCGKGAPCTGIAGALEQSTQERAYELLPALRVLRIRGFHPWSFRLIKSFVAARQLAGRPVITRRLTQNEQDTDWETSEDDTHQA